MKKSYQSKNMGPSVSDLTAEADTPPVDIGGGAMDQSTIDNLLSGIGEPQPTSAPEPPADENTGGALDQSTIDNLLSGIGEPQPASAPEPPADENTGGAMDQSTIDNLLSGIGEPQPASAPEPPADENTGGAMDQGTIDNLLRGIEDQQPAETPPASDSEDAGGAISQEDLDRLLSSAADGQPTVSPMEPSDADLDEQGKMDRLISQITAQDDDPATTARKADPKALERLLASNAPSGISDADSTSPTAAAADEESENLLDPSELDDLFNSLYEEETVGKDSAGSNTQAAPTDAPPEPAAATDNAHRTEPVPEPPAEDARDGVPPPADVIDAPAPSDNGGAPPSPSDAGRPADDTDTAPEGLDNPRIDPLPEEPRQGTRLGSLPTAAPRRRSATLAVAIIAAVLLSGALGGWWWWTQRRAVSPHQAALPGPGAHTAPAPIAKPPILPAKPPGAAAAPVPPPQTLEDLLAGIDRLREAYLLKHREIAALQDHYRSGIRALQDEIRTAAAASEARDFKQTAGNKRIELGLKTIQHRLAYIHKLQTSAERLLVGSEELLYVRREIETDASIVPFARSVTIGQLAARAREALQRFDLTPEKTAVDLSTLSLPPLEEIWQDIVPAPRTPAKPVATAAPKPAAGTAASAASAAVSDSEIWTQICNGTFDNKYRLTDLPADAAACLAAWKGKDLFLNYLDQLSPKSAASLAAWKGDWICLNGLTDLPEPVAAALSKWPGKQLSLNGIKDLSPPAAQHLSRWTGRHLELTGLQALSAETARHLSAWEARGGRVYTPARFRRKAKGRQVRPPPL